MLLRQSGLQVVLWLSIFIAPFVSADVGRQDVSSSHHEDHIDAQYVNEKFSLGHVLHYFEDQNGELTINDVLRRHGSQGWEKSAQSTPTFGFSSSAYWFYVDVVNPSPDVLHKTLQIANPLIDELDLYITVGDRVAESYRTGIRFPFEQRPVKHHDFVFPLVIEAGEEARLYIRVRTLSDWVLPAYLWETEHWQGDVLSEYLVNGAYYGLLLGLALYNLFLFFVIRDRAYLYYALFQLSFALFQLGANGYGYEFLWPDRAGDSTSITYIFAYLPGVFLCLFSHRILSIRGSSVVINRLWLALAGLFATGLVLFPFIADKLYMGMLMANYVVLALAVLFVITSFMYWKLGLVVRIWSVALMSFIVGAALFVLPGAGLVESNLFLENTIQLGSALEAILLSMLLGYRIRQEQKQKSELLEQSDEARQAALAKSRFLAAASHDLRQPLHALSLFVDVLKESKSDAERAALIPRIELSLDALRKLFDALLDISRLDAKVVKPEFSHFDLVELLQSLAAEFRSAASEKNLTLRVHARTAVVVSDRLLLERILRNLIGNAIRYTESGGVLLSARKRGGTVLVQVWDTGVGIAPEYQDDVFVEFRQLHNAHRDRNQGLGLGLAIVNRLSELLHHPLELRSQPGKGSVFSLRIPTGDPRMMVVKEAGGAPHSWDLSGRRIVVVDDEREIRDAMRTLLSKWGCEVITAGSLTEAVQVLHEKGTIPELIISDLRLRDGCTGVEAIDGLRARFGAAIPGILVTGETASEQLCLAKDSGYELLQKPVQPIRLRAVIQQHLTATNC